MKKTKFTVMIAFTLLASFLHANEFVIESYKPLPSDQSARVYEKLDDNGDACAIIKVKTDIKEALQFDSGLKLPHPAEKKYAGEYWVYVSPGEQSLRIMAEGFTPKRISLTSHEIKSHQVYELVLTSKDIKARNIEKDFFTLTFNLNVEGVRIKKDNSAPIKTTGTLAGYELEKGIYTFTFIKNSYKTLIDTFHVNRSSQRDVKLIRGYSDYQESLPGIIIVNSEPSSAEIYLNDKYMGSTPYQGELLEGDYILRLEKEFYYSGETSFSISPKMVKDIPLITLRPNYGYLSVETNPSNAEVYLDGALFSKSPIEKAQVKSGVYDISIKKYLHTDTVDQFSINDLEEKKLSYTILPTYGSLNIDCKNIEKAQIYLSNRFIGETPIKLDTVSYGTYNLLIKKELYKDFEEKIEISGSNTIRNVILLQNYGFIDIFAPNCNIYINERLSGQNHLKKAFLPGSYEIKAIMDNIHYSAEEQIYLTIGETRHVNLNPEFIMGSVSIIANPPEASGAEIYVDGVLQEEKAPAILILPIGVHTITVKHPDFLDNVNNIEIKENGYTQGKFSMLTYKGSLKQKEDFWETQMWIALGGTVVIGGAGVGADFLGAKYLHDYEIATTDASRLRNIYETCFLGRDISYGISVSSLLYAGFAFVQELRFKKMQKNVFGGVSSK